MPTILDVFVIWVVSILQSVRSMLLYLCCAMLFVADFSFEIDCRYDLRQYFYPKVIDSWISSHSILAATSHFDA